jgi:hypothetical protein
MAGALVPPQRPQRAKPPVTSPNRPVTTRSSPTTARRADFEVLETFEAGVVLLGTEVKAIREAA